MEFLIRILLLLGLARCLHGFQDSDQHTFKQEILKRVQALETAMEKTSKQAFTINYIEIAQMKDYMDIVVEERENLLYDLKLMKAEIQALKDDANQVKVSVDELDNEVKTTKHEIDNVMQAVKEASITSAAQLETVKKNISELHASNELIAKDLSARVNQQMENLQGRTGSLSSQLDELKNKHDKLFQEQNNNNQALRKDIQSLENSISEIEQRNVKNEADLSGEMGLLKVQMQEYKLNLDDLRENVTEVNRASSKDFEAIRNNISDMQENNNLISKDISRDNERFSNIFKQLEDLQGATQSQNNGHEDLNKKIQTLETNLITNEEKSTQADTDVNRKIELLNIETEDYRQKIEASLQNVTETNRKASEELQNEIVTLKKEKIETEAKYKQEIDDMKRGLELSDLSIKQLRKDVEVLQHADVQINRKLDTNSHQIVKIENIENDLNTVKDKQKFLRNYLFEKHKLGVGIEDLAGKRNWQFDELWEKYYYMNKTKRIYSHDAAKLDYKGNTFHLLYQNSNGNYYRYADGNEQYEKRQWKIDYLKKRFYFLVLSDLVDDNVMVYSNVPAFEANYEETFFLIFNDEQRNVYYRYADEYEKQTYAFCYYNDDIKMVYKYWSSRLGAYVRVYKSKE